MLTPKTASPDNATGDFTGQAMPTIALFYT